MQAQLNGFPGNQPAMIPTDVVKTAAASGVVSAFGALTTQQQLLDPSTLDFGTLHFTDHLSDLVDHGLGFDLSLTGDSAIADILMDDALSPLGGADPLLSSVSPGASKTSSRHSSFSMEDDS